MAVDGDSVESTGLPRSRTAGPIQRQHLFTVINQLDELQRRGETDLESALLEIAETDVGSLPGAQYAGVALVEKGCHLRTLAATHVYPRWLNDVEREVREGPCLSAALVRPTVRIDDLATDDRWPRYRAVALDRTPVRSILAFRLFDDGKLMGALSFHAEAAGAFDDESIELGLVFAAHTAMAWNAIRRERQFQSALANLESALVNRDIIGQAKGILMERFDIDAAAAFELLSRLSQQSNMKLAEIAEKLIALPHASTEK